MPHLSPAPKNATVLPCITSGSGHHSVCSFTAGFHFHFNLLHCIKTNPSASLCMWLTLLPSQLHLSLILIFLGIYIFDSVLVNYSLKDRKLFCVCMCLSPVSHQKQFQGLLFHSSLFSCIVVYGVCITTYFLLLNLGNLSSVLSCVDLFCCDLCSADC